MGDGDRMLNLLLGVCLIVGGFWGGGGLSWTDVVLVRYVYLISVVLCCCRYLFRDI